MNKQDAERLTLSIEIHALGSKIVELRPMSGAEDWPDEILESMSLADLKELHRRLTMSLRALGGVAQR